MGRIIPAAEYASLAAQADDAASVAPVPARPVDRERDMFRRVGEMLVRFSLPARPDCYAVCHAYLEGSDEALKRKVDAAIAERRFGTAAVVALSPRKQTPKAEELAGVADHAQRMLDHVAGLVGRSREQAGAYACGLDAIDMENDGLDRLVDMTREMIATARAAEDGMRRTSDELDELRADLAKATQLAGNDHLTGLPNRRALDAQLKAMAEDAQTRGSAMAVAIVDVDHFKSVNDTYGHTVGDEVIRQIAALLTTVQGAPPFVGRFGGEEFVMLFADATPDQAAARLDVLRSALGDRRIEVGGKTLARISFSAGVAGTPRHATGTEMLASADKALYRAKHDGRNRVYVAGTME